MLVAWGRFCSTFGRPGLPSLLPRLFLQPIAIKRVCLCSLMPYAIDSIILPLAILIPVLALAPLRVRRAALLAAGLSLYIAHNPPIHAALLCAVVLAAYVMARIMDNVSSLPQRRIALSIGLVATVAPLVCFKIAAFFRGDAVPFDLGRIPLGLAFVSLAMAGYIIEVFRRTITSCSLGTTFLFGTFFPVVPAGPIPRAPDVMPQMETLPPLTPDRFSRACRMILWGVFLKLVVADRLALIVDRLDATAATGGRLADVAALVAAYAYSFQIYADFAAYSDVAIGLALACGLTLPKNFDRPYRSTSLTAFWRRWHISLSSWLKDFVYVPLGGNRVSPPRRVINVLIVFLASGLWHGGSMTFLVWGFIHGVWVAFEQVTKSFRTRFTDVTPPVLSRVLGIAVTFHVVTFSWIVFRAASLHDAFRDMRQAASGLASFPSVFVPLVPFHGLNPAISPVGPTFLRVGVAVAIWMFVEWCWSLPSVSPFEISPSWLRWSAYYLAVLAVAVFGIYDNRPFIYTGF